MKNRKKRTSFSQLVRKFYEDQYRQKHQFPKYYTQTLRRLVRMREEEVFNLLPGGGKMLDVGCGEGWLLRKASYKYQDCWGVDIVDYRIRKGKEEAKKEGITNIRFSVADVNEGLPFEDSLFDTLTCVGSLEYFFDPYFVMREFNRVLKKGGQLIIEVPNVAYFMERIRLLFGKLPGEKYGQFAKGWCGGKLHYFTVGSLSQLFNDSGFKVIKKTGSGFLPFLRTWWLSPLSADLIIVARKTK